MGGILGGKAYSCIAMVIIGAGRWLLVVRFLGQYREKSLLMSVGVHFSLPMAETLEHLAVA